MGLNSAPSGERVHIGIFGRRNAGKSSLINAVTGQAAAIVSETAGTTTDPVYKSMELLPLGPVMIIDTPGIDDEGELGQKRVEASYRVLRKCDMAVLVADKNLSLTDADKTMFERIKEREIPYIVVYNKCDDEDIAFGENEAYVSAKTGRKIHELKEMMARLMKSDSDKTIVGDLVEPKDTAILVVPIDSAAPKGRLILPQQQTIRDLLDHGASAMVVKEDGVRDAIENLKEKPKIVICDSQVFGRVNRDTPEDILLTSFSILFARYKGNLVQNVKGAKALDSLKDGDKVLISEGCTHHRQCDDIGSVKMPRWLKEYTKKELRYEFTSGGEFENDLKKYAVIIHCGGCMLNEKEMKYRLRCAADEGVPMVNYGIAIAYMHGILERSLRPFPSIHELVEEK